MLRPMADGFRRLLRNSVRLEGIAPRSKIPLNASKFGGLPDVPEDFVWPTMRIEMPAPSERFVRANGDRYLALPDGGVVAHQFVAQINLAEVHPHDHDQLLPASGHLLFFFQDTQFESDSIDPQRSRVQSVINGERFYLDLYGYDRWRQSRVIYVPESIRSHPVAAAPSNICRPQRSKRVFAERALSFSSEYTLPSTDDYVLATRTVSLAEQQWRLFLDDEAAERYQEIQYDLRANIGINQMLGWPDLFSHGALAPADESDAMSLARQNSPEARVNECLSVRLLLQISTKLQADCCMDFGRTLFFFIREADLRRRDFSKVWWDME